MKKSILSVIFIVMLGILALPAYAADERFAEPLDNGAVRVVVDDAWAATGVLLEGRTFITLQAMSNIIDAQVEWEMETQQITIIPQGKNSAANTLVLYVGDDKFYKNGSVMPLDVPPQFREGSLLIPISVLADVLDTEAKWQESSRTVFLTTAPSNRSGQKVNTVTKPAPTVITPPTVAAIPQTAPVQPMAETTEVTDERAQGKLSAWGYGLRDGIFVEDMMSEDGYGMNFYIFEQTTDNSRPALDKQIFQLLVTDKYKERIVYTQTFVYGELPRKIGQMANLNVPSQYFNESQYSYEIIVKAM